MENGNSLWWKFKISLPKIENLRFRNSRFGLTNIENSRFLLANIENSRYRNSRLGLPNIENSRLGLQIWKTQDMEIQD